MKFLESITFLGNDVLIPIDRIKHITSTYSDGYKIRIVGDDNCEWEENFGNDGNKALERYKQIKSIVQGK